VAYKNTIKDYSQMVGWLTRDKTTDVPGSMAEGLRTGLYDGGRAGFDNGGKTGGTNVRTRQGFQPGNPGNIQALEEFQIKQTKGKNKKVKKFVELVKKGKTPAEAKNKVIELFKIERSKKAGTPQWMKEGKQQLIDEGIIEITESTPQTILGETENLGGNPDIEKIGTTSERPAQNIKEVKYRNKKTGETFSRFKPLMKNNKVTVSGSGFKTLEEAQKIVDDYLVKNPPKTGQTLKLEDDLRTLFNDPKIKPLLETGIPDKKYIKIAQNAIKGLTESQAEDKLKQLAEAVKPDGVYNIEGIDKIDQNKANDIYKFFKSKDVSRKIEDTAIGKSVGEGSIARPRAVIQEELPFKGGTETYSVDEAKAIKGSYRLGSKPYSIFGQVIDGRINQGAKMGMDAKLSQFEEGVQKAIRGEGDLTVKQAIDKYNAAATQAEKEMNAYKSRGFRKITIPRIAKAPPSQTIANKKAYKKYKKFFDKNFKELGYSFRIPKDMLPVPEIAADMKDKKSPLYKRYFNDIKKAAGQFIDNVDQYDEKELFQKLQKSPMFEKFKKILPRLVSNDDFSEKRYASANNIMSDATYVDDMEEENFIKRNPGTTALGTTALGTAAAATTPKGRNVLKKIGKGIFDKGIRPLGTNLAVVPLNAYTIYDNLKKGENIADAVIDPFVGAEFMLPGLFKENVNKITKNKAIQNLLTFGKYGRLMTPVGAGITAAGLGIDAYKYGKKRIAELQAMSPKERAKLAQERDDFSFGEYSGAAEGGIASLNVNKK